MGKVLSPIFLKYCQDEINVYVEITTYLASLGQ